MIIAFIDDRSDNRDGWLHSLTRLKQAEDELRTYASVEIFLAACEEGAFPDLVFVDFFIDGDYGFQVIDFLQERSPSTRIIAHSSMDAANTGMVKTGAHAMLAKTKGTIPSLSLDARFPTPEDWSAFVQGLFSKD